jgi:hypothetical protein
MKEETLQQKAEAIKLFEEWMNKYHRRIAVDDEKTIHLYTILHLLKKDQQEREAEVERLKEALAAIANQPQERMGWSDQPYRMQNIAMCALHNIPTHPSPAPQQEVSPQPSPTHKYQTGKVWAISESTPEGLSIEGNHNWKEGQLLSEGEDFYKAENYFTKKGHPTSFNSDHHEYSEEVAIPLLQPSPTVQEPSTEQADSRNQWVKHFNPPFKHAEDSTFILDSHGNIVIEVRGWGHLSNLMTDIKACEVQDQIANHITDILNSSTEHKKEGGGQ